MKSAFQSCPVPFSVQLETSPVSADTPDCCEPRQLGHGSACRVVAHRQRVRRRMGSDLGLPNELTRNVKLDLGSRDLAIVDSIFIIDHQIYGVWIQALEGNLLHISKAKELMYRPCSRVLIVHGEEE